MQPSWTFLRARPAELRGNDQETAASSLAREAVDRVAARLAALGVSANAVTGVALAIGLAGGVLLSAGCFGWATAAVATASVGDAIDGALSRRTRTASPSGALFDASADRYQEFACLAGLAIYFREHVPLLVLVLLAMLGSFMVSYGSAKAEALRVPVPPGVMRRAERAVCLCVGIALTAACEHLTTNHWSDWARRAPLLFSLTLIAVVGNVSAIARLRCVARAARDLAH